MAKKKSSTAVAESSPAAVAKKAKSSTAVADASAGPSRKPLAKGWAEITRFLQKDAKAHHRDSPSHKELIHILACSWVNGELQAEVNFYTGGNHYVAFTPVVTEKAPGIYFATTKHVKWSDLSEEDRGPQTPVATVSHLRWLGTRRDFLGTLTENSRHLGKKKLGMLKDMLTHNVGESSDAATCGTSADSSS